MLKSKNFTLISLVLFIAAEIILGYFIQKVSGLTYSVLTLLSIIIACCFAAIFYRKNSLSYLLTLIALISTVFADFFLCGLIDFENIRVVAMLFFCITQACYFLRLYFNQKYTREKKVHVILRVSLSLTVLLITIIVLKEKVDALSLISMLYFTNLILNIVFSFIQIKIAPLFAVGLLLFSLCDALIGLDVLEEFMTIPDGSLIQRINDIDINLAWVFYVPSQTLISTDIIINEKDC